MRRFHLLSATALVCSIGDGQGESGGGERPNPFAGLAKAQTNESAEPEGANANRSDPEVALDPDAKVFAKQDGQDENTRPTPGDLELAEANADKQTEVSERLNAGNDALDTLNAAEGMAVEAEGENQGMVEYTSHPIDNYKFGRFQFNKGRLTLNASDAADLDRILDDDATPGRVKARIRKIDIAAAERLAGTFRQTRRIRGVDTSRPGPSGGTA